MFELDDLEDTEVTLDESITDMLVGNAITEADWSDLRPVLRFALTQAWDEPEDYRIVGFVVLYAATEITNWRDFVTEDNLKAFFEDSHFFEMCDRASTLDSVWGKRIYNEFLMFMSEQFISIFRP